MIEAGDPVPSFERSGDAPADGHDRRQWRIEPEALGSKQFRSGYGLKYAYLAGAMYKGIASSDLVVALGRSGLMGYLGTGGLSLEEVDRAISRIRDSLAPDAPFGVNLLHNVVEPMLEARTVDLFLSRDVRRVEAAAYMQATRPLVKYRVSGIRSGSDGRAEPRNSVLAKVSHPEVAAMFMRPPPGVHLQSLVETGEITHEEAELGQEIPLAAEICVESDSAGHTDHGAASALFPAMLRIRDDAVAAGNFMNPIHLGAAGGIGTPEAVAAAFIMGADFVMTGSINQCTVEAGTSDRVKDLLQVIDVQDTAYAPAGDLFEIGAKVQVLKRGVFFPARAAKLYDLYTRHASWSEIDPGIRDMIEKKYFRRSVDEVWAETSEYYRVHRPQKLVECAESPKKKLALILKWYFIHSTRLALAGDEQHLDYQIHCGPALGAFNRWVKGTPLENWRERRVAHIADRLMQGAADLLTSRFQGWARAGGGELVSQ